MDSTWTANATAFESPDGRRVVVVHNPFDRTERLTLQAGETTLALDLPAESLNTVVV